jgi:hypothetical protein
MGPILHLNASPSLRKFLNIWEWLKPYLSNLLKIQDGVKNDRKET